MLKRLDYAMITTQSFFSFSHKGDMPLTPLSAVTLSDHFPIHFSLVWHIAMPHTYKTQFYLNTSLFSHLPTTTHII